MGSCASATDKQDKTNNAAQNGPPYTDFRMRDLVDFCRLPSTISRPRRLSMMETKVWTKVVRGRLWLLLQPEAFIDQPLQARAVENIVGKFFVREHAERGAAGIRRHLGGLFQRQIGILADHRHHHAHHHLQATEPSRLVDAFIVFSAWLVGWLNFHSAPVDL